MKAVSPTQPRSACPRPACHPWSRGHLPGSIPGSGCLSLDVWAGGLPWRVPVPSTEDPEGWRVAEQLCIVGGRAFMAPTGQESAGESLCAGCTRGLSNHRLNRRPLLVPKPLMELLWDCLPNPTVDSKGPRPFPSSTLFCRNFWVFFFFFFNQHHTMLPKATSRLSQITTVKYYSCTVPNLALACSDKTLYVFCKA